jgi:hypothetical protein
MPGERRSWDRSMIQEAGGVSEPVKAWRIPEHLTLNFGRLLKKHEIMTAQRVLSFAGKNGKPDNKVESR